jgi:Ser-tRNA(Ala) deacylase AlaX
MNAASRLTAIFYPLGGGQLGDTGTMVRASGTAHSDFRYAQN